MNCRLENADMIHKQGMKQHFDQVYLRGSQIKFVVVPDMFKNAPMFKRVKAQSKTRNAALLREKYQQYKRTAPPALLPLCSRSSSSPSDGPSCQERQVSYTRKAVGVPARREAAFRLLFDINKRVGSQRKA